MYSASMTYKGVTSSTKLSSTLVSSGIAGFNLLSHSGAMTTWDADDTGPKKCKIKMINLHATINQKYTAFGFLSIYH